MKIEHKDVIQTTEYWLDTMPNKLTFKNLMLGPPLSGGPGAAAPFAPWLIWHCLSPAQDILDLSNAT